MAESKLSGSAETNSSNPRQESPKHAVAVGLLQENFTARDNAFLESALQESTLATRTLDVHSALAVTDTEALITSIFAHTDPELNSITEKNRLITAEATSFAMDPIARLARSSITADSIAKGFNPEASASISSENATNFVHGADLSLADFKALQFAHSKVLNIVTNGLDRRGLDRSQSALLNNEMQYQHSVANTEANLDEGGNIEHADKLDSNTEVAVKQTNVEKAA